MNTYPEIVQSLKGKTCWRPWRGMQSALFFEFGEKDKKERRGEYTIGIVGCPWQVFQNDELLFNSKSEYAEMDLLQQRFVNSTLIDIVRDQEQHEDSLLFSDGLKIQMYLNADDDEWHILSPDEECVLTRSSIEIYARVD